MILLVITEAIFVVVIVIAIIILIVIGRYDCRRMLVGIIIVIMMMIRNSIGFVVVGTATASVGPTIYEVAESMHQKQHDNHSEYK